MCRRACVSLRCARKTQHKRRLSLCQRQAHEAFVLFLIHQGRSTRATDWISTVLKGELHWFYTESESIYNSCIKSLVSCAELGRATTPNRLQRRCATTCVTILNSRLSLSHSACSILLLNCSALLIFMSRHHHKQRKLTRVK